MSPNEEYRLQDLELLPSTNILLSLDEDTKHWVAHCLEMDLVDDGATQFEAIMNLFKTMIAQMDECHKEGVRFMTPAPDEYYEKLENAKDISIQEITREHSMPYIPTKISIREMAV